MMNPTNSITQFNLWLTSTASPLLFRVCKQRQPIRTPGVAPAVLSLPVQKKKKLCYHMVPPASPGQGNDLLRLSMYMELCNAEWSAAREKQILDHVSVVDLLADMNRWHVFHIFVCVIIIRRTQIIDLLAKNGFTFVGVFHCLLCPLSVSHTGVMNPFKF
jgi:hypothetical protein